MQAAPLFPAAAGMITGIVIDRYSPQSRWVYLSVFVIVSVLTLSRGIRARFGLFTVFAAASCLGAMLHLGSARVVSPSGIERYASDTGRIARLRGWVTSEPRILTRGEHPFRRWTYGTDRSAFLLDVESIEGTDGDIVVTGRVRVSVEELILDLRENQEVELFGRLHALRPPQNPGGFDWASLFRRQGVVASLRCKHRENVRFLERMSDTPPTNPLSLYGRQILSWVRTTARGLLIDDLATGATEEASLLEAMVLGHRSRVDRRLNELFIRAGCAHFLAVSGAHVAMLLSFVWLVGRLLGFTKRRCAWLMMGTVLAYVLVAEPRPSILRAGVMATFFCISLLLYRPIARLNWLAAACVILLLIDPGMLFDVGFHLSFVAVLGVIYLTSALHGFARAARRWFERVVLNRPFAEEDRRLMRFRTPRDARLQSRLDRWLLFGQRFAVTALAFSFAAWLATLPVVAIHFQRVQPWGPISSAVVFPIMGLVIPLGFTKVLVGVISPYLGTGVGVPLTVLDSVLIRVVELFAALPGATVDVAVPPWWVVSPYYVLFILFAWRFRPRPQPEEQENHPWQLPTTPPRWLGSACGVALASLALSVIIWLWPSGPSGRLVVTVLSVGPGSATVIELPEGGTVLYDAGTSYPFDVGRSTVVPFLKHRGIYRVDRVYVSHPNLDHFSAVPTLIQEIPTGPVVVNEYFDLKSPERSPSRYLVKLLAERDHPVEVLDPSLPRWELGGVTFELLWPVAPRVFEPDAFEPGPSGRADSTQAEARGSLDETLTANDTSTVLRLSYAGHSILLTGDIGDRAQRPLIRNADLHADVLLLPHHGGVQSSTAEFLQQVGASILIRSSHQRMKDTTNGLRQIVGSTPVYNTADVGAVEVVIDRKGVRVRIANEE